MHARIASLCILLPLSACSLVKLSEDIEQGRCKSNSDCEVLNLRNSASFDACELWQCTSSNYCEFLPLDADRDGFTPHVTRGADGEELVCEARADKQDCDDGNEASRPGLTERCDNIDNDCDALVDEGELEAKSELIVPFTGASRDGIGDLSYAVDPVSGKLGLAFSLNRTSNLPGFGVLEPTLAAGAKVFEVVPPMGQSGLGADEVALAALGSDRFAMAFVNRSGARRLVVGALATSADAMTLEASDELLAYGVSCRPSETCVSEALPANMANPPPTGKPALAASSSDVLVAYVRAETDANCHDKGDDVAENALLLNLLETSSSEGMIEQTSEPFVLSEAAHAEAPALLAIPPIATSDGMKSFGFLIAFVNAKGEVVLSRIQTDAGAIAASSELLRFGNPDERYSNVSLALGPQDQDGQVVGLAMQRGCTVDSRALSALVRVSVDAAGAPLTTQISDPTAVGGAASEREARIAYSKQRRSWGVVYRDPRGLRARVLSASGAPVGEQAYLLIENATSGSDALRVGLAPAIVPMESALGWFGAVAYADREGQDPAHGVLSGTISSCQVK